MNSEILASTLVTCFEGGSNDWAVKAQLNPKIIAKEKPWYDNPTVLGDPKFFFTLTDCEGAEHKLTLQSFNKGWDTLCQVYPSRAERIAEDDGSADADDYDVLLQITVYGVVVYG